MMTSLRELVGGGGEPEWAGRLRQHWTSPRWNADAWRAAQADLGVSDEHLLRAVRWFQNPRNGYTEPFRPPINMVVGMAAAYQEADEAEVRRLSGRGVDGVNFIQSVPDPRDPPGTIRWIAVQPDGRRIPEGAVGVDDLGDAL